VLAALLVGLGWPSLTRADGFTVAGRGLEDAPPTSGKPQSCLEGTQPGRKGRGQVQAAVDEEEEEDKPLPEAERLRLLAMLGSIMLLSGDERPPPNSSPPLVVKSPDTVTIASVDSSDSPPGGPPGLSTPEPASLATGLFGAAIAGAAAWLRRQRAHRAPWAEKERVEAEDDMFLATAA
jgi:hypothetical protein